jgi:hypothetical protein
MIKKAKTNNLLKKSVTSGIFSYIEAVTTHLAAKTHAAPAPVTARAASLKRKN